MNTGNGPSASVHTTPAAAAPAARPARHRPMIAIPARFSVRASALRYAAEVAARALVEAVWRGGGEPFIMHPADPEGVPGRLARCDGVLLPGGGDLTPTSYGVTEAHASLYDVDEEQDRFDLAVAEHSLTAGLPTLAICRGLQVLNAVAGGTLRQHLNPDHRDLVHHVIVERDSLLAKTCDQQGLTVSCYHHQAIDTLGTGMAITARATDGTVEAVELPDAGSWLLAVQWHPEDTAATDANQQALFNALVKAAAGGAPPSTPT